MKNRADTFRWRNVPVPEAHVAGIVLGAALHRLIPRHVTQTVQPLRKAGWTLVGAGILLGAWAVRAAGIGDMESPSELIRTGPFAYSRNPMYVAWTALYVGIGCIINTRWLFRLLPIVLIWTHSTVRQEERSLERAFGDEYHEFKTEVRRYL